MSKAIRPDVLRYTNYREYIRDFVEFLKAQGRYSTRRFAQQAKLGSNGYLKMVMDGRRDLSEKTGLSIAKAFGLPLHEEEFFLQLMSFNKSKESDQKNYLFAELQRYKKANISSKESIDSYMYYSQWYNVALMEMISEDWQELNQASLASSLDISISKLKEALGVLKRLSLIEIKDRKIRKTEILLQTPKEVQSLSIINFHEQMIEKALQSLLQDKRDERDLRALSVKLSKEEFDELQAELWRFLQKLLKKYGQDKPGGRVYQINTQVFPLSRLIKK